MPLIASLEKAVQTPKRDFLFLLSNTHTRRPTKQVVDPVSLPPRPRRRQHRRPAMAAVAATADPPSKDSTDLMSIDSPCPCLMLNKLQKKLFTEVFFFLLDLPPITLCEWSCVSCRGIWPQPTSSAVRCTTRSNNRRSRCRHRPSTTRTLWRHKSLVRSCSSVLDYARFPALISDLLFFFHHVSCQLFTFMNLDWTGYYAGPTQGRRDAATEHSNPAESTAVLRSQEPGFLARW